MSEEYLKTTAFPVRGLRKGKNLWYEIPQRVCKMKEWLNGELGSEESFGLASH